MTNLLEQTAAGDLVILPAPREAQTAVVRQLVEQWGGGRGPTPNNLICWTDGVFVDILLAREQYQKVGARQAIETVNRLVESTHPAIERKDATIRVLANLDALLYCLTMGEEDLYYSEPLAVMVKPCWNVEILLFHEIAAKLMNRGHPEWVCAVYGSAIDELPDLVYDERTLDNLEMAAIVAGSAPVPLRDSSADALWRQVQERARSAEALPPIALGYKAVSCSVPLDGDNRHMEWAVDRKRYSFLKRCRAHLIALWLGGKAAKLLPEGDPDLLIQGNSAKQLIVIYWKRRLDRKERAELDEFAERLIHEKLSKAWGLNLEDFSEAF